MFDLIVATAYQHLCYMSGVFIACIIHTISLGPGVFLVLFAFIEVSEKHFACMYRVDGIVYSSSISSRLSVVLTPENLPL